MSLAMRQEKKSRRRNVGIAGLVIGTGLLAVGIYSFVRGGAEILGFWGIGFGIGGIAVGIVMLRKAATASW